MYPDPEAGYIRTFDDHLNVWMEGRTPPVDYLIGSSIGHQSSCGFVNYVNFNLPIMRIILCLGFNKNHAGSDISQIAGLKFDIKNRSSTLLGRCAALGPGIELDNDDSIIAVHVGLKKVGKADFVDEIIFRTRHGLCKGFRGGSIVTEGGISDAIRLCSTDGMALVGMTWAFDFGYSSNGDHGIHPLYRVRSAEVLGFAVDAIHATLEWAQPPPSGLQLRPLPAAEEIRAPLASSLSETDYPEDFPDSSIVSIIVYYNSFLQGIKIHYQNGQTRTVGNSVGVRDEIELHQERIFAVAMRERRQHLYRNHLLPGDLLCIEGIQFGLVKRDNGKAGVRYSPWFGSAEPFGPFINAQRGLWHPLSGGSAQWSGIFPSYTNRIFLQPGTSFAGFYAETTSTHNRSFGVLVGTHHPLPPDVLSLKSSGAFPAQKPLKPTTRDQSLVPWLGAPPPEIVHLSDYIGYRKGMYRMWCPLPPEISKVIIYRHNHWNIRCIIGLEFFGRELQGNADTLLGFRSLWMEHAIVLEFGDNEKLLGIASKTVEIRDNVPALSALQVIALPSDLPPRGHCQSQMMLTG